MLVILTLKDQMNNYKKGLKNVAIHFNFLISIYMLENTFYTF